MQALCACTHTHTYKFFTKKWDDILILCNTPILLMALNIFQQHIILNVSRAFHFMGVPQFI